MSTKKLTITSILIVLSIIGSHVKILGSIALDSFSAFIASSLLGATTGGVVALVGHFVSALLSGFPLSLPVHLIISLFVYLAAWIFGFIRKRKIKIGIKKAIFSSFIAYLVNAPIALFCLYPILGKSAVMTLLFPLSIATLINIIISDTVLKILPNNIKYKLTKI